MPLEPKQNGDVGVHLEGRAKVNLYMAPSFFAGRLKPNAQNPSFNYLQ